MQIKAWLITILILLIIAALAFFPITVTRTVTVASNFDNTYRMLNNLNEWQKWNPQLKQICTGDYGKKDLKNKKKQGIIFISGGDSISIINPTPLSYYIDGNLNNHFVSYNLILIPSSSTNSVQVQTLEKEKLIHYFFPKTYFSEGQKAITSLKEFLESTSNVYGFNIKTENVVDTVFAVYEYATDSANLFITLNENFKLIDNYIEQRHLEKKGFYSVSYSATQDSLRLILGIPVNKFAEPSDHVHCVNIPKGKMLTGFYEGKFLNKHTIYTSFARYASDHYLENVGAPFESYINNKLPSSDTSIIKFKFYYPRL